MEIYIEADKLDSMEPPANEPAIRDAFEEAVVQYQGGLGPIDTVYKLGMPVFSRLARSAAYRMGIPEETDEIAQDLGYMFLTQIVHTYDPEQSIYPYLRTFAGNLARTLSRKKRDTPNANDLLAGNDADGEPTEPSRDYGLLVAGLDGREADDAMESVIAKIDKDAALKKIGEKLYSSSSATKVGGMKKGSNSRQGLPDVGFFVEKAKGPACRNPTAKILSVSEAKTPSQAAQRRNKVDGTRAKLTPDQQELRAIRIELQMSQPDFADAININVPRLSSYEYGRTAGVPTSIMEAARELKRSMSRDREGVKSVYEGKTMAEIVDAWSRQLAQSMVLEGLLTPDEEFVTDALIARTLGVTETTVRRWRNEEARPTLQTIIRHNETISFLVTTRKLRAEKKRSAK